MYHRDKITSVGLLLRGKFRGIRNFANSAEKLSFFVVLESVGAVLRDRSKHGHRVKGFSSWQVEHRENYVADKFYK